MAVPTLLALRPDLRTALPKAIAQDPWPARAIATILTGTGDVTGDVDLALASVEAFAGRVAAGGPAPESVRNLVRMLLPRLGSHTRQLSWPVLANCTGLDGDLDRYVAAQLDIALAGGDAEKVLVQLAEAATGDLEELIAATVEIFTPARTMSTSTGRS
jgi:hypothetical protein